MNLLRSFLRPHVVAALICITALFVSSCATQPSFPSPTAAWTTHTGQVLYRSPGGRSVIGEFVVRQHGTRDFQLDLRSGPGFPLLRLWQAGETARAEGVLARGSWTGSRASAPAHLESWLALREAFQRVRAGERNITTPALAAAATYGNGRVSTLQVRNSASGETLNFQFNR